MTVTINLKGIDALEIDGASAASVADGVASFAVASSTSPGGSSGDIQYNNSGAFGGVAKVPLSKGGTNADLSASGGATQVLAQDAGHVVSARDLIAADIPALAASKITTGQLALARGGTGVDLSAAGGATQVLAQDASHVVSARDLIAADIPALAASKITSGQLALARGGTNADLSATGSTHGVLAQDASHVVSVRQLAYSDISGSPPAPAGVFPSPTMGLQSYLYPAIGSITNFTAVGHDTSTSFGTVGGNGGGVGQYIGITMSGTTKSGYIGSLCHPFNAAPYMNTMWGLGTGITNTLSWVGLTENNGTIQLAGNVPSGNYAMFRYANGTDTTLKCITCDNVTQTIVDSGVTVTANTIYKLTINLDFANSQVLFYINGTLVATITTHLPTAATALAWFSGITQTSGTGNQIFIGRTYIFDQLG